MVEKSNGTPSPPKTTVTAKLNATVHIPPNDMYLPILTYVAGTWMWTKKDASTLHAIKISFYVVLKTEERIKSERMLHR